MQYSQRASRFHSKILIATAKGLHVDNVACRSKSEASVKLNEPERIRCGPLGRFARAEFRAPGYRRARARAELLVDCAISSHALLEREEAACRFNATSSGCRLLRESEYAIGGGVDIRG